MALFCLIYYKRSTHYPNKVSRLPGMVAVDNFPRFNGQIIDTLKVKTEFKCGNERHKNVIIFLTLGSIAYI